MPGVDKGKFIRMKALADNADFTDFFICVISEISEKKNEISEKNYTLADGTDFTDFFICVISEICEKKTKSARNK